MWKPADESRDAYASENGLRDDSWWSKASSTSSSSNSSTAAAAPGEQIDCLLSEYLQTSSTEAGSERKEANANANAEEQNPAPGARFEHPHSIGSYIPPPQVPGIEIAMMGGGVGGHPPSPWARQEAHETSGPPDDLDGGSDGLHAFRDDGDVAGEVGGGCDVGRRRRRGGSGEREEDDVDGDGSSRGAQDRSRACSCPSTSPASCPSCRQSHSHSGPGDGETDAAGSGGGGAEGGGLEGGLLLSPLDRLAADQLQSTGAGSLVKPELPHKQGASSPTPPASDISSLHPHPHPHPHLHQHQTSHHHHHHLHSHPHPQPQPHSLSHPAHAQTLPPSKARAFHHLSAARLRSAPARRSLSAVQHYRLLDERQAKRAPLWRRRVNYKSSFSDTEEMLATARTQAFDLAGPTTVRYPVQHEASYFLHKEPSATDHGDLFPPNIPTDLPLSPPLSSGRQSFLCPNGNVAPHINGNYNLSTESLPSNVEAEAINLLSRPHSMPQLQEQMETPYASSQGRQYLNHSPTHEYLSPEHSFDDAGAIMKPQPPLSAYPSFNNAPCPITESLDLDNAEDSSSSAQGSSPQAWWGQGVNLELAQDDPSLLYPASSGPTTAAGGFTSLPNMSPKRRFNQTPSNDNLNGQMMLLQHQQQQQGQQQGQQQPRSPILESDRLYAFMGGQQAHSAMPSPPGSPSYYFSQQITPADGFCSPTSASGVNFIDPFHNSAAHHHQPHQHAAFNTFPRRTPLSKSMLGYDTPVQSTPPIPLRTVPSHGNHINGASRSSYLRKAGSLGRSARMPPMGGKNNQDGVAFVNFTPHDATKILSGVAPSGSSKTKARREREAQEKRRKLSEAAAAAVLAAGGDPTSIQGIEFE
ncbi:hypothetical protein Dda_8204 [Drechslerella dactyloides]|uniref:Developmental regulatory protein wetA n=1 Tax=Drechslerella dactyloides TaxID=74499 RepID=A0AAD6IRM0_DREDA|nr:hypothetical protein Dda_8204 [Drechslerella dactyloides]